MLFDHGIYGYLAPAIAYLLLTTVLVISWRGHALATLATAASFASTLWAAIAVTYAATPLVPAGLYHLAELVRLGLWCLLLLKLLEDMRQSQLPGWPNAMVWGGVGVATAMLALPLFSESSAPIATPIVGLMPVLLAGTGLLLVAGIYRNAGPEQRWSVRWLCFGLGAVFAADILLHVYGLLLTRVDPWLWQTRGIINAVAVPPIAVALARYLSRGLRLQVSRHVVFHSCLLMGTGLYLILTAVCGYFIRFYGGSWGGVIQVAFLCLSGALLFTVLSSTRIRAWLRVFLSKHFLSYKYDYRQEWSRFTEALSSCDVSVPNRVVSAIARLVQSNSGLLWLRGETGFKLIESWNTTAPTGSAEDPLGQATSFFERQQWVIDIEEFRQNPGLYPGLELSEALLKCQDAWLLIPLLLGDSVIGAVMLTKPAVPQPMNWEDRDLLKVAGRQAASELAQYKYNQELVKARQFEAFNRLSAYVVHDLKNILAQQSLIVSNAEQHKHNPEFVEDVVGTVENSVNRMKRLMDQMRSGMRAVHTGNIEINELLQSVVERHSTREPRPLLAATEQRITSPADPEQLATVFGHIIQNAQEACAENGTVEVVLEPRDDGTAVISIRDNGVGMDEAFIRERLFQPFETTKGLTGMGVGAFESREYIRSLGGDIEVTSAPGVGSLFRITLPCQQTETEYGEWPVQESTY